MAAASAEDENLRKLMQHGFLRGAIKEAKRRVEERIQAGVLTVTDEEDFMLLLDQELED